MSAITLSDRIKTSFEKENLDDFTDSIFKSNFIKRIESETNASHDLVKSHIYKILKKKIKEQNKNPDDFISKRTPRKKFSSKLDITANIKKTDTPLDKEKAIGITTQNPKSKLIQSPNQLQEYPLGSVAGAVNSFVGAFFEDMEEMTDTEKEDVGTCMNMAFGEYLTTHANMKKLFGIVGILGVYGGKIKKARKIKKKRDSENKKQIEEKPKLLTTTTDDKKDFDEKSQNFLKEKLDEL